MIAPDWLVKQGAQRVLEGKFSDDQIVNFNCEGYNIYYLPNTPVDYQEGTSVEGSHISNFNYVFVDFDLKSLTHGSKEAFLEKIYEKAEDLTPAKIVDSGNGIHVYWKVSDLDAKSYLRLSRRLIRLFNTDEAVGKIFQLMRLPGTLNTKIEDNLIQCELLAETDAIYTCEELNKLLPPITPEDERFCEQHYDKTYNLNKININIDDTLPPKFGKLIRDNGEAKAIWSGNTTDRSKDDYRLGHLMLAADFTKEEAVSVLVNSAKAMSRAPVHRVNYATNIVDKIWTYEEAPKDSKPSLSSSVEDILKAPIDTLKGTRFRCYNFFDGTDHGFRLSQVIGLCAGVGVGKTAIGLNMFRGFVEQNPNMVHIFAALEQPGREIADRWRKMCGDNTSLHSKVHILSNYNDDGSYRNLSLTEIQEYIIQFQKDTGFKVGCVCIDHIGVLKQESKSGEYQGLRDLCAQLKSFAVATDTLLIIQSQTNRDKAGIGDLELHKDAAFGSQSFESYVDYLMVAWQPLKRCYDNPECPRVTAYKFAKIRFKSKKDTIIEDQCYRLFFEQDTETLRPITQEEEISFDFFANQALVLRKKDRKTDLVTYKSVKWDKDGI